jgi:8-oxo-dGTP pyrophosphatase MutT (NUDIX family)
LRAGGRRQLARPCPGEFLSWAFFLIKEDQMIKHYVLSWVQRGNSDNDTFLILKNKPAWQNGKLNLPGGQVEEGESPVQAIVRELEEEAGFHPIFPPRELGLLQDASNCIHCFRSVIYKEDSEPKPREGETEQALWMKWHEALNDPRLIPNLRVIIPLLRLGVEGWVIGDTYRSSNKPLHTIKIAVRS